MNWKISNGVLFAGNQRVILVHVVGYASEAPTLIIQTTNGYRMSLNAGAELPAMIEALDAHFSNDEPSEVEKELSGITECLESIDGTLAQIRDNIQPQ